MSVDVIVVGAGPVGLTAAIELRRRGVDVLIVDKRDSVAPWAKAVGVQPRTLEIWDQVGVVDAALAASVTMRGQLAWVNGSPTGAVELRLPEQVPYDFICLPQYATEDVLIDHLASLGTGVTRGTELVDVDARDDGVIATLRDAGGERTVDAQYLIAAQGAHSTVRKALGIDFTGDAFAEEYMLADVELDWSLPAGYAVRSTHRTDGVVDDVLVCIPLPGRGRYRVSMLVPDELSRRQRAAEDIVAHGISGEGPKPELHHVQAVLDRLLDLLLLSALREWFARPEVEAPAWYRASLDPVVGRALRLLHDEPARAWTVAELADEAGVSRATFARRFTELLGEPPKSYLTSWRLTLAADLLSRTERTVDAIARQVGFSNAYALSVAFKRLHGTRPSAYRT